MLTILGNIGKILQNMREYDEALKYLQESQEILEKNHPAMRLHNF